MEVKRNLITQIKKHMMVIMVMKIKRKHSLIMMVEQQIEKFVNRLAYCGIMKINNIIPINTDCEKWVLTYEGFSEIAKYENH